MFSEVEDKRELWSSMITNLLRKKKKAYWQKNGAKEDPTVTSSVPLLCSRVCSSLIFEVHLILGAELKIVANLVNQVRGTLWESGEPFDQIFTLY